MVTANQFAAVLAHLRNMYAYVIVDAAHTLSDITLSVFDASDLVVLVTTQDIPALARVRKFLDLTSLINLDRQRVLIVLNKFDKRIGITPDRISETFQREIAAVIPVEPQVVVPSINRGVPFMLHQQAMSRPVGRGLLETIEAVRAQIKKLEEAQVNLEEE
jgi:pilus assembly protein CpaE